MAEKRYFVTFEEFISAWLVKEFWKFVKSLWLKGFQGRLYFEVLTNIVRFYQFICIVDEVVVS